MFQSKRSVELSPKLKLGVSRGYSSQKNLKIGAIICLVIAGILAVNAFRLLVNNHSVISLAGAASPQVLGASDTKNLNDTPSLNFVDYKVQKGDTLFNVSQRFNIDWTTLATLNNLKRPFSLKPGQVIQVPKQ